MDRTREFDQQDIDENKSIAFFAYFGILFVVPLFAARQSDYARFHANQGMIFFFDQILLIIFDVISYALIGTFPTVMPLVWFILTMAFSLGSIFMVLFGVINTVKGKAKELPLIGRMKMLR